MRQARRKVVPILPIFHALADFLEANQELYICCGHSFYQDYSMDDEGKFSIIFGCLDLVREVLGQGGREFHADTTFKIVPSRPTCWQLFIMHLII